MSTSALEARARRLAKLVGWRLHRHHNHYMLIDSNGSIIIGGESCELSLKEAFRILLAQ